MYDLETHKTDRVRPYCTSFLHLSKLAGRYNRDLSQYETEKCDKDNFVLDGDECIIKALDFLLKMEGEERKVKNRVHECDLELHVHNGSVFDTWITLNNLPCDNHLVDIIKNEKNIFVFKSFQWVFTK